MIPSVCAPTRSIILPALVIWIGLKYVSWNRAIMVEFCVAAH